MNTTRTLILAIAALGWLWMGFTLRYPAKWAAIVDKENAFWVSRGLLSTALAERFKRIEKGRTLKLLVALITTGSTLFLIFTLAWK